MKRVSRKLIIARRAVAPQTRQTSGARTGRRISRAAYRTRLIAASQRHYITRFNAVKEFGGNASLMLSHWTDGTYQLLPVYAILLNGRITTPGIAPLMRLCLSSTGTTNGQLFWISVNGVDQTGAANSALTMEYNDTETDMEATPRLMWNWSSIKLNLVGATSNSTKFQVDICKVKEEGINPWFQPFAVMPAEGQQCWMEMVKQFIYNPISQMNINNKKGIKILKTFVKQANVSQQSIGGVPPDTHTLNWFSRWNRVVNYDRIIGVPNEPNAELVRITDAAAFDSTLAPLEVAQKSYRGIPNDNECVFALIRASAFGKDLPETGANYGSFDILMRSKFASFG